MDIQAILQTLTVVVSVFAAVAGALLLAVWLSLIIWTFHDVRLRSNDVFTQLMATLLVAVLFIPGVLLYMLLRPPETLGAQRERKLLEDALRPQVEEPEFVCPACERPVERRWMVCPYCLYQLREPCSQCGELMELDWRSCAFCGQLAGEQHHPSAAALAAAAVSSPQISVDRATAPAPQLTGREARPI